MSLCYTIQAACGPTVLDAAWDDPPWYAAEEAKIEHFHAAGSSHRPDSRAKLLHDATHLYLRFRVDDHYVVVKHGQFQDPVCRDSCVEFFVQPRPASGYFNFELNCGGTLLCYYIEDPTRTADGFAKFTPLSSAQGRRIRVIHSLPATVLPEIAGPIVWHMACAIPLEIIEAHAGPLGPLPGQAWRGNFFKCADDSSHPHWGSWAPIGEALNFHQPQYFAPLRFAMAAGCD